MEQVHVWYPLINVHDVKHIDQTFSISGKHGAGSEGLSEATRHLASVTQLSGVKIPIGNNSG